METLTNQLSDRINNLAASATLAMAAKARELRAEGKDIIGLSLGEPDFNTPDFIKDAAIQAVNDNYNSYTPVDGYVELKDAIINKFKRDNKLTYDRSQIVVSTGAKQSLYNVAQVCLNPGDEVLLPCPYWVSYSDIVKLAEGVPVEVETSLDTDFKMTPEQLEAAITPKTKMLWYSSPCNPSGSIYSEAELRALADVLQKHPQIVVVSDEIYEHINYVGGHASMAQFEDMYDRVVTVNGVAKAFAMTGWRIGYIGAPAYIARACNKIQGQVTSGANCIAQRAVITALEAPVSKIQYMVDEFKERRKLILGLLNDIEGFECNEPEGAFYVFPNISHYFGKTLNGTTINNASDFALYILEQANVATVTGEAFGNPNCIRISYAASQDQIKEALARIKKAVS
ncbi:MAG: pyridoxal phosphate-dependent aminotransferase [Bacteroidota bacterium]|uniref:pyridoxal phosphate-dependent aminotransferase n=1 Tax=Leeuwenhoekiella palythoae TaxID=573501 RepID=UPI000C5DE1BC|nr:pyridoxal phosphate-dependent aminotransferase [Leeuwenhoekiella palythoae]MBH13615.1 aspartate aminotransferase [Leeuwenhoekiella sp.]MEC7784197.1 pyridoxal phosphate-dependent aminotransferase [Bacteroidota bacterium]MEE3147700.1 pyridoxal phosphate-dependent aminotransferase [Bacteroidota bacterium]MEE3245281.1 pyridoxal phosphate-dependent aminotransferase [Bacteroidota bacterium]UBZ09573.1 pyridoxal phosphate-dependent aminotransferase [Leeuwenhoekiella palythoae]|tara:strand:- start:3178 stop:4374 length:1197 start_codon:yes stop_codon:yes gene_type:complete